MSQLIIHFTAHCGGLGDRIVGLVSAIVLAKYMNRNLKIKWSHPNISNVFDVPLLIPTSVPMPNAMILNCIDKKAKYKKELTSLPIESMWPNKDIVLQCNQNIAEFIYQNPHITTEEYKKEMKEIYQSIFKMYLIPKCDVSCKINGDYIGVQLRTGDNYMNVGQRMFVKNVQLTLKKIATFLMKRQPLKQIYFTSDHPKAYSILRSMLPKEYVMFHNANSIVHFERSKQNSKLNSLIDDLFVLSRATQLFISAYSNYGRLAVLMNSQEHHFGMEENTNVIKPITALQCFSK